MFIQCSNNNRASTVYKSSLRAVQRYGLPSRIRCDQGGENILVSQHMLHHRGSERRSVLVGSSVHNQCIECLWRDMHRSITGMFYRLSYFLEHHNLLDPINEVHLYALRYVFLPRINEALQHCSMIVFYMIMKRKVFQLKTERVLKSPQVASIHQKSS